MTIPLHIQCQQEADRTRAVYCVVGSELWPLNNLVDVLRREDGKTVLPPIHFVAFPQGWKYQPKEQRR